jgi:hypothetical protein
VAITTYQLNPGNNDPVGASFMDVTSPSYLVTEIQTLKADIRAQSLDKTWRSLYGLQGAWTGNLIWTFISGTSASIQGDQTVGTGTGYVVVGGRVQAFVTAGTIYGTIISAVPAGGITTCTFAWDSGVLDSGLGDIQLALDLSKITVAPTNYVVITNSGSAWTGAVSPIILAYNQGAAFSVKWSAPSQGTDTLALNGLAALPFRKMSTFGMLPLAAGDIPAQAITDIIYDSMFGTWNIIGGPTITPQINLQTGAPLAAVTSSTAETTLMSYFLPGNYLVPNGVLRLHAEGNYGNASGISATFTLKFYYGSVATLTAVSPLFPTGPGIGTWTIDVTLANRGGAASQWATMIGNCNPG